MPRRAPTQSLATQSLLLIAGRLAGFAFAFCIPVALIRLLDQDAFGAYKQFFLVGGFLVSVLPVGLDAGLFYFIPRDRRRAGHYLLQAAAVVFGIGVIAAAAVWWFRRPLAASLNSPVMAGLAALLAVYLLFELITQLIERAIVIEGQGHVAALTFAASDALRAVALILPAVLTRSLLWVCVGAAGYGVVRLLVMGPWAVWQYRGRFRADGPAVSLSTQLRYALPFGAGSTLRHALLRFHAFYVAGAFSTAAFGVYAVGTQQIVPVQVFFRSLFEVALVRMSEYVGAGRVEEMRVLWRKLIAHQAAVILPLVVALWMLAQDFVEGVFTSAYLEATPIFRINLLLIVLTMLNDHAVLRAWGRTGFIFATTIVGLVVSLVLVPVLTALMGLSGAALGLVGGMAAMKLVGLMKVGQLLDMSFSSVLPWRDLARYLAGAAVAAALVYPTRPLIGHPLARFLACGALFWLIYLFVAWGGNLFSLEDKRVIASAAKSARGRLGAIVS